MNRKKRESVEHVSLGRTVRETRPQCTDSFEINDCACWISSFRTVEWKEFFALSIASRRPCGSWRSIAWTNSKARKCNAVIFFFPMELFVYLFDVFQRLSDSFLRRPRTVYLPNCRNAYFSADQHRILVEYVHRPVTWIVRSAQVSSRRRLSSHDGYSDEHWLAKYVAEVCVLWSLGQHWRTSVLPVGHVQERRFLLEKESPFYFSSFFDLSLYQTDREVQCTRE